MRFGKILQLFDKKHEDEIYKILDKNEKINKTRDWLGYTVILIFISIILNILFLIKYYDYTPPAIYQVSKETLKNNTYNQKLIYLNNPRVTQYALKRWTKETINNIYNFDFNNFDKQLNDKEKYFSPSGFKAFKKSIEEIGLKNSIVDKKQIVTLTVSQTPMILGNGDGFVYTSENGDTHWKMRVNAILTTTAGLTVYKDVVIDLDIVLISSNKKSGLYISEMNMQ